MHEFTDTRDESTLDEIWLVDTIRYLPKGRQEKRSTF